MEEKVSFRDALDDAAEKLFARSEGPGIELPDIHADVREKLQSAPKEPPRQVDTTPEPDAEPVAEADPVAEVEESEPQAESAAEPDQPESFDLDQEIARLEAEEKERAAKAPVADPPRLPDPAPNPPPAAKAKIVDSFGGRDLTDTERALLQLIEQQKSKIDEFGAFKDQVQKAREEHERAQAVQKLIDRTMDLTKKYPDVYEGPFGELAKTEVKRRLYETDESEALIVARVAKQYADAERAQRKSYLEKKIKQQRGRVVKRGGSPATTSSRKKAAPSGRELATGALVDVVASRL